MKLKDLLSTIKESEGTENSHIEVCYDSDPDGDWDEWDEINIHNPMFDEFKDSKVTAIRVYDNRMRIKIDWGD